MGKFVVDEYLRSQGLTLKGKNSETGQFQVSRVDDDGEEKLGTFDARQFLQAQNVDISNIDIVANTPDSAINENKLGFLEQMDLLAAKKPGEKISYLESKYGKGSVDITQGKYGDTSIVVKGEDGVWSKADTGFLASIVKESPVIAAGVAGSISGAKMGAVLGPKGILVGSILGGAIGSTLGRLTDVASAEAAGIRTESDAMDAMEELGKEFAFSVASAALMYGGGRVVVKGVETLGGPIKGMLENASGIAAQITRRSKDTFDTLFDPKYTRQVSSLVNELVENEGKAGLPSVDKATRMQISSVNQILKTAKSKSYAQYESFKNQLRASGEFDKIRVDMNPVLDKIKEIKGAIFDRSPGSVSSSVDPATLKKMTDIINRFEIATASKTGARIAQLSKTLEKTYNPTKRAKIQGLIDKLSSKSEVKNEITFDAAEGLKRNIDEMLELSGYRAQGDHAISSTGRMLFQDLRDSLVEQSSKSLKGTSGVKVWNDMRTQYHSFRKIYDNFAITGKRFANDERAAQTINRMMGEKGAFLKDSFNDVAKLANNPQAMDTLKIAAAAKELQPMYSINKGGIGQPISVAMSGGLTSPRAVNRHLALNKISKGVVSTLNGLGKGVDFFTKLDAKSRVSLLNNEALYKPIFRSLYEAGDSEAALTQELMQGVGR